MKRGTVWIFHANGNIERRVMESGAAVTPDEFKAKAYEYYRERNLGEGHLEFGPIGDPWNVMTAAASV